MEEDKILKLVLDKGKSTVPSFIRKITLTVDNPEYAFEIPNEPIAFLGYQTEQDDVYVYATLYTKKNLLEGNEKWFIVLNNSIVSPAVSFLKFVRRDYDSEIVVRAKWTKELY